MLPGSMLPGSMLDLSARPFGSSSRGMSGILGILLDARVILLSHRPRRKKKRKQQCPCKPQSHYFTSVFVANLRQVIPQDRIHLNYAPGKSVIQESVANSLRESEMPWDYFPL
jgi:hypothetical protein